MYHSYELESSKAIMQIPVGLFRKPKMAKETWTRVGEIHLLLRVTNNENAEIAVEAKIKVEPEPTPTPNRMEEENCKAEHAMTNHGKVEVVDVE